MRAPATSRGAEARLTVAGQRTAEDGPIRAGALETTGNKVLRQSKVGLLENAEI